MFSAVPGTEAATAACSVRDLLRPDTVYLEISTVTPRTAGEIAADMAEAGLDYVDIGATGVFPAQGYQVPMLLAGAGAERAGAWMTAFGFEAKVLFPEIGDATAVKMLRGVLMKGLEALTLECLVAARRKGLVDEVLDCLGDVDRLPFAEFVSRLVASHLVHAERRLVEVEEVNETLEDAGLTPLMSAATRRSHARTVVADVTPADGRISNLEDALRILDERVVKLGGS